MRPAGQARRPRILGICEGGATPPGGMQRRPNAQLFPGHCTRPRAYTSPAAQGAAAGQLTQDGGRVPEHHASQGPAWDQLNPTMVLFEARSMTRNSHGRLSPRAEARQASLD